MTVAEEAGHGQNIFDRVGEEGGMLT